MAEPSPEPFVTTTAEPAEPLFVTAEPEPSEPLAGVIADAGAVRAVVGHHRRARAGRAGTLLGRPASSPPSGRMTKNHTAAPPAASRRRSRNQRSARLLGSLGRLRLGRDRAHAGRLRRRILRDGARRSGRGRRRRRRGVGAQRDLPRARCRAWSSRPRRGRRRRRIARAGRSVSGGLGRPGAESRSTTGDGFALASAAAVGSRPASSRAAWSSTSPRPLRRARARADPRASSRRAVAARGELVARRSSRSVAVCHRRSARSSSSSARTLVASSNASSANSSASEWNGIGLRQRRLLAVRVALRAAADCRAAEQRFLHRRRRDARRRVREHRRLGRSRSARRCGACFAFSARIRSSTVWLPSARRSNRTPMPGAIAGRLGSFSRVHTTVPSPAISGDASRSWNSNLICVPTASGSFVRMKMPP